MTEIKQAIITLLKEANQTNCPDIAHAVKALSEADNNIPDDNKIELPTEKTVIISPLMLQELRKQLAADLEVNYGLHNAKNYF